MTTNKNKKFNWKPERGSFRKIQESFLKKKVFISEYSWKDYVDTSTAGKTPPDPTPEQSAIAKKYKILGKFSIPAIDMNFIKKHNLEKTWKRKQIDPRVQKIAAEFSKEIKNSNGNMNQIKKAMMKHFSKSDGWIKGNPFNDVMKYQGIEVSSGSGTVSIKDLAARKGFDISLKTGDGKGTSTPGRGAGTPYNFSQKPAGNEGEAKDGGYTGYWDGW
jgi:hypothetical protein